MTNNDHIRALPSTYTIKVSSDLSDEQWDRFLQQIPMGHHVQSSLWGILKNSHSWQSIRVTICDKDQIVAGAQFLTKKIPLWGKIGYIQQGPVFANDTELTADQLMEMIDLAMKQESIRLVFITPPYHTSSFKDYLQKNQIPRIEIELFPHATTIVDLDQDLDTILKNMKSKTRYNIRLAARKGVIIREAEKDELPIFHQMLQNTAGRNGFEPYELEYFEEMYRIFSPGGHFKLLFAECDGEILSSVLLIIFGETVIYKKGGWSGTGGNLHPNEALHWNAINWSQEHGYKYYDFEGITEKAAHLALADKKLSDEGVDMLSRFKLGFGGEAIVLPKTYLYSRNPLLLWFASQEQALSTLMNVASKFLNYIRS